MMLQRSLKSAHAVRRDRRLTLLIALLFCFAPLVGCDDDDVGRTDPYEDGDTYGQYDTDGDQRQTADNTDQQDGDQADDGSQVYGTPRDRQRQGSGSDQGNLHGPIALEWEGPDQLRAGEDFSYRVHVSNDSDMPVDQVVLHSRVVMNGSSQASPGAAAQQGNDQQRQDAQGQQQPQTDASQTDASQADGSQASPAKQAQDSPTDAANQKQGAAGQLNAQSQNAQNQQQAQQSQQQNQRTRAQRTWNVGALMPGESKTIIIRDAFHTEGQAKVCLGVSYEPMMCKVVEVVKPQLRLTRRIVNADGESVQEAYICDEIYALYVVENVGSGETGTVTISEEFPQGVSAEGSRTLQTQLDPIAAGEKTEHRVKLQVDERAQLEGAALASTEQMKVRSEPLQQQIRFLDPSLSLAIDGPQKQYPSRTVTQTVTVTNTSDDPAVQTRVMINPQQNAEQVSVSTGSYDEQNQTIQIGRLEGGASRNVEVSYVLPQPGEAQFSAAVAAHCVDQIEKQTTTQIVGLASLRLETIDLTDPVAQGEATVYSIRVKNQGTAADQNIKLTAQLPQGLEYVDASGETNVQANGNQLTFGTVDQLEPGKTVEWRLSVRANESGRKQLKLDLNSDATDNPVEEQEMTTVY